MCTQTETETLEDLICDVPDLQAGAQVIMDCITTAESVETMSDLAANIDEAIEHAANLIKELKALRKRVVL